MWYLGPAVATADVHYDVVLTMEKATKRVSEGSYVPP